MINVSKRVLIIILAIVFVFTFESKSWAGSTNINDFQQPFTISESEKNEVFKLNIKSSDIPPLNALRISGELTAGILSSILSITIFLALDWMIRSNSTLYSSVNIMSLGGIVILFAPLIGINLIGNIGDETGSFSFMALGSLVGLFLSIIGSLYVAVTFPKSYSNRGDKISGIFGILLIIFSTIMPTAFFNMSRKYKYIEENIAKVRLTNTGISYKLMSF